MNPWQMAQQLRHELRAVTWPSGGSTVFGTSGVFVFAGQPSEDALPSAFPFALVTIDSGAADPDEPSLIRQSFAIAVAVECAGDPLGEFAVIGGGRPAAGNSAGAGLAEVAERVRYAVQKLTGADGAGLVVSSTGIGAPTTIGRGRHLTIESFALEALCTSQEHYAAPQEMSRNANILRWNGARCSPRFDFLRYRVGWVAGATPASAPSGTTIVYTGTAQECAVTVTPGRVYQVFADYVPRGGATVAASSEAIVGSYVAV